MHFCQSQLASFLLQDNSCILESDLDPSSSSRLSAAWQKAALLRTTKADAIGASAIEKQQQKQERGYCLHPFILLEQPLSSQAQLSSPFVCSAIAVTPCFSTSGPHLWLSLISNPPSFLWFAHPLSFLSSLFVLSLSGMENKVGLFVVHLVPATSLILWTLSDRLFVASFLQQQTISGILNCSRWRHQMFQ